MCRCCCHFSRQSSNCTQWKVGWRVNTSKTGEERLWYGSWSGNSSRSQQWLWSLKTISNLCTPNAQKILKWRHGVALWQYVTFTKWCHDITCMQMCDRRQHHSYFVYNHHASFYRKASTTKGRSQELSESWQETRSIPDDSTLEDHNIKDGNTIYILMEQEQYIDIDVVCGQITYKQLVNHNMTVKQFKNLLIQQEWGCISLQRIWSCSTCNNQRCHTRASFGWWDFTTSFFQSWEIWQATCGWSICIYKSNKFIWHDFIPQNCKIQHYMWSEENDHEIFM